MRGTWYLAWKYLLYHRWRTAILVAALTITMAIPLGLTTAIRSSAEAMTGRATSTPLLIGAKGSPLELVLDCLYFEPGSPLTIPVQEMARAQAIDGIAVTPLHSLYHCEGWPIIGTDTSYLAQRDLRVASGRAWERIGECVLGYHAAQNFGVEVGDSIISSPQDTFNLAGSYPLKIAVTGILSSTGTADDRAIFTDIQTCWIIAGLAHGHDTAHDDKAHDDKANGHSVVSGIREYQEITQENIHTFHFHGDTATFPLTGLIAWPDSAKASALLKGHYLEHAKDVHMVIPEQIIQDLLGTVFAVRDYVLVTMTGVGLATIAVICLVIILSVKLRSAELKTMQRIGAGRLTIYGLLGKELLSVLVMAGALALATYWLLSLFGPPLMRSLIIGA